MTATAVAGDGPEDTSPAAQRGWAVYEYLRKYTGRGFTYLDLSLGLGIVYGRLLRDAVSYARRLADERDEHITWTFMADGERVLVHNPSEEDFLRSKTTRAAAITGQEVNYLKGVEWGARHCPTPAVRKALTREARAHAGAMMMTSALADMTADLLGESEQ